MIQPIEAYQTYLALKRHFASGSYDYFKYNGKVRVKASTFQQRKDRFYFEKLAKKFATTDELAKFFVSGLVTNPNLYIRDMVGIHAEERHINWKRHQQNLMYDFNQEIQVIADAQAESFDELLACSDGQHPPLLQYYIGGSISIETLLAFDWVFGCFKRWNKDISDPIVWPGIYEFTLAYKPFVTLDNIKIKEIMRKVFVPKMQR